MGKNKSSRRLVSPIFSLISSVVTSLPKDVDRAIRNARSREKNKLAKMQLDLIIENIKIARKEKIPICQDTGTPIFYLKVQSAKQANELKLACISAIKKATSEGILRPNIVDPFTRKNKGNVGELVPVFEVELVEGGKKCEVMYVAKGAGSENCSRLLMLTPNDDIVSSVMNEVKKIGGKPCAPYILGIGAGGTADLCAKLAKKACLRQLGKRSANRNARALEMRLEKEINETGIGTMGLGGAITCLSVNCEAADTHTGSLPVSLCFMCWCERRGKISIKF